MHTHTPTLGPDDLQITVGSTSSAGEVNLASWKKGTPNNLCLYRSEEQGKNTILGENLGLRLPSSVNRFQSDCDKLVHGAKGPNVPFAYLPSLFRMPSGWVGFGLVVSACLKREHTLTATDCINETIFIMIIRHKLTYRLKIKPILNQKGDFKV